LKIFKKLSVAACLVALTAPAQAADSFTDALIGGTASGDFRFRIKFSDTVGKRLNAYSVTLRSRLTYETADWNNFSALIEPEDVSIIGQDRYNTTTNGKSQYPLVADAPGTEMNRAFIQYIPQAETKIRYGRQWLEFDHQRFVYKADWRQHSQTFDAFTVINTSVPDVKIHYGRVTHVNRLYGDESPYGNADINSHFLNITINKYKAAKTILFAYLNEYQNGGYPGPSDFLRFTPERSHQTLGIDVGGPIPLNDDWTLLYKVSGAVQSPYADSTITQSVHWYHLRLGFSYKGYTALLIKEQFSNDNGYTFNVPFFPEFLNQKGINFDGVNIEGLALQKKWGDKLVVKGGFRQFTTYHSGKDLGEDTDLYIEYFLTKNYRVGTRLTLYNHVERDVYTDAKKASVWFRFTF